MTDSERNAMLVAQYLEGESAASLAKAYGITRQRVYQILDLEGARARDTKGAREARADQAARLVVESGGQVTIAEAANLHRLTYQTVARAVANLGFDYRAARVALRQAEWAARVRGDGTTTCSSCGQEKPWAEMAMAKAPDGTPTRRRVCKVCSNERSMRSKNRSKQP